MVLLSISPFRVSLYGIKRFSYKKTYAKYLFHNLLSYPRYCPTRKYGLFFLVRVSPILVSFILPHYCGSTQRILRTEPSSRIFLMGEQPNPWKLLHLQDKMSRHRGAEQSRRYELSGSTSLFM